MTLTSPPRTAPAVAQPPGRRSARDGGGLLGRVTPNSPTHWALLFLSVAASVLFTATWAIDEALRPGYDALAQPVSALSLGPGGWVQTANFAVFGALSCVVAFASRPTLAPGLGAAWYPRLRVLAGVAMIGAAVFSQDAAHGWPIGAAVAAHPSVHGMLHNLVSMISLTTTVAELIIMARRLHREPRWAGWAPAAYASAVLMMTCLATFGTLIAHNGPGGIFEKLASLIPTLFGIALTTRLLHNRDARL